MGVHNPAALPLLALLGVLVLLYLRRQTRTRIEVPGFLFWDAVPEDRVRARRFRPDPLFYLQALLLLLLVGGLLQPYRTRSVTETHGRRHVLVIDRSASMQAREDGRTRFDMALERAGDVVRAAAPLDEIMLIGVAARPTVVSGFTADHRLVLHKLDTLRPLDTGTRIDAGIELGLLQRDRAGRQARVHVFSDRPTDGLRLPEPRRRALAWHHVGETDDNLAVAAVHVSQPPFQDAAAARAYVLVRNYAARGKAATLRARLNGRLVFEEAFRLPAREARSFSLRGFDGPGRLDVGLETDDALAVDDRALAWVAGRRDWRLVLVSPDARFADEVRRVSRALSGVGLVHVAPEEFTPARLGVGDVALFHRVVPAVPASGLYVFPPAGNPLFPVLAEAADVRILDWNQDHAILRNVQYVDALPVGGVRVLDPPGWAHVLISSRTTHGEIPLALAGERNGQRMVCLAFDLDAGALTDADNLTLLVLFLNALRWLQPPDPAAPRLLPVGATFFVPEGVGESGLRLSTPGADARPLDDDTFGLDRTGVYRVAGDAYRALLYANLFDEAESDIGRPDAPDGDAVARTSVGSPPETRTGTRTVEREVPVEFDRWLYWLAAALLAGEWLYALVRERLGQQPA